MSTQFFISIFFCLLLFSNIAGAATIEVGGSCSFTDAIHAANNDAVFGGCTSGSGSDVIVFVEANQILSVNQGAFFSSVQNNVMVAFPTIETAVTIEGNGLHIQADTSQQQFRVLDMIGALGELLTIRNLTISGGDDGHGNGSGLFVFGGRLLIENARFTANRGGVLLLEVADAEIHNSVIDNNWTSVDSALSAGIESIASNLLLMNSSIINNRIEFEGTDFEMNRSQGAGGLGISMSFSASAVVVNSTISGNSAITGGGLVIRESRHEKNTGTLNIGVGLHIEVINSTITNNTALFGGGVVVHESFIPVSFSHTLIVGNFSDQSLGRELLVGDKVNLMMNDFNVIQQHELSTVVMNAMGVNDVFTTQSIGDILTPLIAIENQWVHLLVTGSDAIDAGALDCFSINDQLMHVRPVDGDGNGVAHCDAGSVEMSDFIFSSGFEHNKL